MKTAVSIPDDVFADAERLARHLKKSRSQLYSHALREYVARHAGERVTESLNKVCDETAGDKNSQQDRAFSSSAGRRRLRRAAW